MALTQRQKDFCEEYLRTRNATKAATAAGYSAKTAYSIGNENLKKPEISAYIKSRLDEINAEQIASTDEVMRFFTSVMRGEEKDQFGLDAALSDRIKAGQEIMKRFEITKATQTDEGNAHIIVLADRINNPEENRVLDDFEDGDSDG